LGDFQDINKIFEEEQKKVIGKRKSGKKIIEEYEEEEKSFKGTMKTYEDDIKDFIKYGESERKKFELDALRKLEEENEEDRELDREEDEFEELQLRQNKTINDNGGDSNQKIDL